MDETAQQPMRDAHERPQSRERHISRRTAIASLAGLAGAGVIATGIDWQTVAHAQALPPASSHIPPGTTLLIYRGHSGSVGGVAWSPNSQHIASASADTTVQVWKPSDGRLVFTYRNHPAAVNAVAWSPNSQRIASGGGTIMGNPGVQDYRVQVWNAFSGSNILYYSGHSDYISALKWSPNGKYIASASYDKTVQVWHARTGQPLTTYRGHTSQVLGIAWSPDSTRIASAGSFGDKTVQVWDALTGQTLLTYLGHINAALVLCVDWSHDGKRIASGDGGADATVQVWEASNGKLLLTYLGHSVNRAAAHPNSGSGRGVFSLAWAPQDKQIVSGDGVGGKAGDFTAQVWNSSIGTTGVIYRGHASFVDTVTWSPRGNRVASGSGDTTVQEWQAI
jgi:WD40 repeat protein